MSNGKLKTLLLPQIVEERQRRKNIDMHLSSYLLDDYPTLYYLLSLVSSNELRREFDDSSDSTLLETSLTYSSTSSLSSQSLGLRSKRPSSPIVPEETFRSEKSYYVPQDEIDITYTEIDDSELYCCLYDPGLDKSTPIKKPKTRFVSRLGRKFPSISSRQKVAKNDARSNSSVEAFPDCTPLDSTNNRPCEKNSTNYTSRPPLSEIPKSNILNIKDRDMINLSKSWDETYEENRHELTLQQLVNEASASNRKLSQSLIAQASAVTGATRSSADNTSVDESENIQYYRSNSSSLKTRSSISSLITPPPISQYSMFGLSDSDDRWAEELGHFNFTIFPKPYIPLVYDSESYPKFLCDWDLARYKYTQHITNICEYYGVTSKIYRLTEEKWGFISRLWQSNNNLIFKNVQDGYSLSASNKKPPLSEESLPVSVSSSEPSGESKSIQNEETVALMEEVKVGHTQPTMKSRIFNFLKQRKSLSRLSLN